MLDELKEESIVNRVGGRFRLSTLIRKRMVALNTGARPLIDARTNDRLTIVIQEILNDRIYLDTSGNLQTRNAMADETVRTMIYSTVPMPQNREPLEMNTADNMMDDDD